MLKCHPNFCGTDTMCHPTYPRLHVKLLGTTGVGDKWSYRLKEGIMNAKAKICSKQLQQR